MREAASVTEVSAHAVGTGVASATPEDRAARMPELELRETSDGWLDIANVGTGPAYGLLVQPLPGTPLHLAAITPNRLHPTEVWRAGQHLRDADDSGRHTARLQWSDPIGETHSIDVELD